MKVLLAGASGALGVPIARRLIHHGHEVLGLTRSENGSDRLIKLGVTPVIADALDADGLLRALDGYTADAVIHELTALRKPPLRHRGMSTTNQLRIEGTANLLSAAEQLGARRFLTQSIILGYGYRDHGTNVLTEDAPFGVSDGGPSDPHVKAMRSTEQQAFTAPEGIALRYGMLYGGDVQLRTMLAKRMVPVFTGGELGWIHHEDAAAATVAALEHGRAGQAYNIVDDLPATWQQVVTAMADALGTPSPWRLPRWMLRLIAPLIASVAVDTSMRVSNKKAQAELEWRPSFRTYHEGIAAMVDQLGGVADDADVLPHRHRA
jgi:nucleoside-diphosphate-sugar epimerase